MSCDSLRLGRDHGPFTLKTVSSAPKGVDRCWAVIPTPLRLWQTGGDPPGFGGMGGSFEKWIRPRLVSELETPPALALDRQVFGHAPSLKEQQTVPSQTCGHLDPDFEASQTCDSRFGGQI